MKKLPVRKNIRLSPEAYRQGHVFFVTIRTSKRNEWFRLFPLLALALNQLLWKISKERKSDLYAWCIMPDHLHLLVKDKDLSGFARILKGRLTSIARDILAGKQLWQKSYYDHALRSDESAKDAAIYIWRNPVRKSIVSHASFYRWSGSMVWPDWLAEV